ncbi:MAG: glycosyltransferase family 4 protein [Candidatus Omnitrophica bacterium]|nr:glycosyltransferase family 4 protein [Candidatus Omnitrophota bacterium]MBU4478982.1 glycosyltransferase family 4 protein [Candidatus Omnitrophota bacterium]
MKIYKVAFLVSHPIQYFSPLFKKMAKHPQIDLTIYYCSGEIMKGVKDAGFGVEVKWDIPLLEGYKYKFLKNYSPIPATLKPLIGLINFGIIREIAKNKYDAVIVHGWSYVTCALAYMTAIFNRIPVFIRAESPLSRELTKPKWKILAKKPLLSALFKQVSSFLAIGRENREFYKFYGVPDNRIFLTPYAVENERFIKNYVDLIDKKDEIKKNLGIPSDKMVILFSGKFIDEKRPMDLLLAYEKTSAENKALVYVGDGYLRRNLEQYVKKKKLENVYFTGFMNQTEIPGYYVIADIFVLPSAGENWGLVVNEAMCFHLPVIVSNMGGCAKDLVRHNENGYVYPMGDIDKLSFYLGDLINDKEKRAGFGKKSLEIVQEYSYEKDVEGIISALESKKNDKFHRDF